MKVFHRGRLAGALSVLLAGAAVPAFAETTVRIGHVLADSHSWHIAAQGFAKDVADKTAGEVKVEIFPGGQLGAEKDVIEGLQFGSVQGGIIGAGSFQAVEPKLGIIEMPYAWPTREKAFAALDGELGSALGGLLEEKGIKVLAWWENGFRDVTNSKRPIATPADLEGLKIRVTPDKVRLETFEALGAQPAPLAFGELYSALQQGVFDAQENPLAVIESSTFFDVKKNFSNTQHVWGAAALGLSKPVWDKLTPEQQQIVEAAAKDWGAKQRQMVTDGTAETIRNLEAKGMVFNEVDKAAFEAAVKPVWDNNASVFGDDLMALVEKYRQ